MKVARWNEKRVKSRPLRIAVDTKNLALFKGGIAAFFAPLLQAWIASRPQYQFILVGPPFKSLDMPNCSNWAQHFIKWPLLLPRPLRHPVYDNILFPIAIRAVNPDIVFTPYHDVRLPRGIPSMMMVHDTCYQDLPEVYPLRIRGYYLYMLKRNLEVSSHILTVSETSRLTVQARYGVSDDCIGVVYNSLDSRMKQSKTAHELAEKLRKERGEGLHLFYSGGSEHRKNIRRLALAVAELVAAETNPHIWITGSRDAGWNKCLADLAISVSSRFHFLGRITLDLLAANYLASKVVVYPTLCEGFGRVALEAMEFGRPLACSDIEVLREVAGDYPKYFNPLDPTAIARAISEAADQGELTPRQREEFQAEAVAKAFIRQMDEFVGRYESIHD